jgi:hypothetical protein
MRFLGWLILIDSDEWGVYASYARLLLRRLFRIYILLRFKDF